ncbi:MAG: glutamyl-tRNA reductase [Bacteroidota bacterium]
MNVLLVGISHLTAPVDVREKMWMSGEEIPGVLKLLRGRFFDECAIISTCNRTEVYGVTPGVRFDDGAIRLSLIDCKGAGGMVDPSHFYGGFSGGAVHHLFKVAAGMDSMVIGDVQILGQVRESFQQAQASGALGPVLNRLLQASLHVGKRVRTETALCEGAVSVSYAAAELASKIFADLSRTSVLLVGAGETGELTVRHLAGRGVGEIRIANRTRERAEEVAGRLGGSVVEYASVGEAMGGADIVITSVSSSSPVLGEEDARRAMKHRPHRPLFLIDMGVPRNVQRSAARIENVFLYDMDSLGSIVDGNLQRRKAEIPRVTGIIRQELVEFFHWHNSHQVGPTIQELREALEAIRHEEVVKNIHRFELRDRELVELITRRIVNKILHHPVTTLRAGAGNGRGAADTLRRVRALRELFGIGRGSEEARDG